MKPTIYRLIFRTNDCSDYDVYEQHKCQEKGCFWTDPEYTGQVCLIGHIDEFVKDYQEKILEGVIDEVVVE